MCFIKDQTKCRVLVKKKKNFCLPNIEYCADSISKSLSNLTLFLHYFHYICFEQVQHFLQVIASKMPFEARAVSHEMLMEEAATEKVNVERNMNLYTWEYMIKNNMLGCRKYAKKIDYVFFGKYL